MSALTWSLEVLLSTALSLLGGAGDAKPAPAAPAARAVEAAVCGERSPCRAVGVHAAGQGARKQPLWVAEVALHDREGEDWKQPDLQDCASWEVWLLEGPAGKPRATQKLLALCNDGYGAAMMGEDVLEVGPNRLTHTQHGGSNWRWSTTKALRLSPLALLEERSEGRWTVGPNEETQRWSWAEARGDVSWAAPVCRDDGTMPEPVEGAALPRHRYETLPRVDLAREVVEGGWKELGLGTCALRLDASERRGFVLDPTAPAATPGDGALRALMVDGTTLLLEVTDDALTSAKADDRDQIEVYLGPQLGFSDHCVDPQARVHRFIVDLATGDVRGDGALPRVERHVAKAGKGVAVRLKVTLPEEIGNLTLVHVDADPGEHPRRVASSALDPLSAATLGGWRHLGDARCVPRKGQLTLQPPGPAGRDTPAL